MPVISGPHIRRLSRPSLDAGEGIDPSAMIAANVNREPYSPLTSEPQAAAQVAPVAPSAPSAAPAGGDLENQLRRMIVESAIRQYQQPVQTRQYPQYQPLEREQTTGVKNRILGAIEGLAAGYGRTGNWAGALGGMAGGAINRNAARGQLWQQTQLPQELRRISWQQQQDTLSRKQAMDKFKLLTDAANAVRGLRDPNDVYKPVSGSEYATIFNPRTGAYEVMYDDAGNPIEAASVVNAKARNSTTIENTKLRSMGQMEVAKYRASVQKALQQMKSDTALRLGNLRADTQKTMKQADLISRTPVDSFDATPAEIAAAKKFQPNLLGLPDADVGQLLKEQKRAEAQKRGLPNAQAGNDFLSGWKPFNRAIKK